MTEAEILETNRALRCWSDEVRTRSRAARQAARATRVGVPDSRAGAPPQAEPETALGDIAVSDLFVILVDDHDLGVLDAVRALAIGLALAGYPADFDRVTAADALDILHVALHPEG